MQTSQSAEDVDLGSTEYACVKSVSRLKALVASLIVSESTRDQIFRERFNDCGFDTSEHSSMEEWRIVVDKGPSVGSFGRQELQYGTTKLCVPRRAQPSRFTLFAEPGSAPDSRLTLMYSDIYSVDHLEPEELQRNVAPLHLDDPTGFGPAASSTDMTILVSREGYFEETSKCHRGVGWGLEIVKWRQESLLRVGRVCRTSPTDMAGICTGDVIMNVAGVRSDEISTTSELATCLLGVREYSLHSRASAGNPDAMLDIISILVKHKVPLDEVVLCVRRLSWDRSPKPKAKQSMGSSHKPTRWSKGGPTGD